MMFCPRCGSLLRVSKGQASCSCGFTKAAEERFTEAGTHGSTVLPVVSDVNPMATEKHVCKMCGFDKAILVPPPAAVRETWNSGEADRESYVCGKCGFKEFVS
jgi:ribosomal protein S27AE